MDRMLGYGDVLQKYCDTLNSSVYKGTHKIRLLSQAYA